MWWDRSQESVDQKIIWLCFLLEFSWPHSLETGEEDDTGDEMVDHDDVEDMCPDDAHQELSHIIQHQLFIWSSH